jgi:ribosomal protein L7Ae-like RNA K-turn-binding protein
MPISRTNVVAVLTVLANETDPQAARRSAVVISKEKEVPYQFMATKRATSILAASAKADLNHGRPVAEVHAHGTI